MADVAVRASTGGAVTGAGTSHTVTFPGTPQVGDPIGIWYTTDTNGQTVTAPAGWTLAYSTNVVNGSRAFLHKIYTSGDGASVAVPWSSSPNLVYACVVLDGSVHADFGTPGTITTRSASGTTTTALATGDTTTPNLVVSHEKASTHGSAPTISPSTTTVQNQYGTTSGAGSVYVGSYDTTSGTADRTVTYPTASGNGAAYQIPATLVAPSLTPVTATVSESWNVRAQVTATDSESWNVRAAVTASDAETWSVRARVTASVSESWDVLADLPDFGPPGSAQVFFLIGTTWRAPGRPSVGSAGPSALTTTTSRTTSTTLKTRG